MSKIVKPSHFSQNFLEAFRTRYPNFATQIQVEVKSNNFGDSLVIRRPSPSEQSGELLLLTENEEITIAFANLFHCHCADSEEAFSFLDELFGEALCVAAFYDGEKALGGCTFAAGEDPLTQGFDDATRVCARSWNGKFNFDLKKS